MNAKELINNTCDACGRRDIRKTKMFKGIRLCARCHNMIPPVHIHYEYFMW